MNHGRRQNQSVHEHQSALDSLNREIRAFTSKAFKPGMAHGQADLVASLIEEEDFSASLGEALYQIARRVERHPFGVKALDAVNEMVDFVDRGVQRRLAGHSAPSAAESDKAIVAMRERCVATADMPSEDRGALLALLGSAERAFFLAERVAAERRSVSRELPQALREPMMGGLAPQGA